MQPTNNSAHNEKTETKNLEVSLIDEFSTLPDKFFSFTHEGISVMWLKESSNNPIRGIRSSKKYIQS